MSKVCVIFSCLIVVIAIRADQQIPDVAVLNLYHNNLDFFDTFLSPAEIDGLEYSVEDIPLKTIENLYHAWNSYTTMTSEMLSWCVQWNITVDEPIFIEKNSSLLEDIEEFTANVNRRINEMKTYFESITTINQTPNTDTKNNNLRNITLPSKSSVEEITTQTFEDKINYAKNIINKAVQTSQVVNNHANKIFNSKQTKTSCKSIMNKFGIPR